MLFAKNLTLNNVEATAFQSNLVYLIIIFSVIMVGTLKFISVRDWISNQWIPTLKFSISDFIYYILFLYHYLRYHIHDLYILFHFREASSVQQFEFSSFGFMNYL